MLRPLKDETDVPQALHERNKLNVVLARVPGKGLHFFHAECARRPDFWMTGISELVLPFPDQGVDLVVCQGSDKLPDILGLVLVVLGVIVNCSLRNIGPIGYF